MRREEAVPLVLGLTEGTFAGLGVNYLWESLKLPGYGVNVIRIAEDKYLGADDLAEIGIGGIVALAGSGLIPKTQRNYHYIGLGIGIITGVFFSKLIETKGGTIVPITFGAFPQKLTVPLIKEI